MTIQRILIVSGTHGNEINPVWAVKQFNRKENRLNNGIEYEYIIGNPAAYEKLRDDLIKGTYYTPDYLDSIKNDGFQQNI